jgi:eukaryotic-like serine/threonine-protein kinase
LEYVQGASLTEYCDQKKLGIRERLELFVRICEGVQHAHQKAIIHRDLKPANILVVEIEGKPMPRIIEFGLAKTTTPQVAGQAFVTQAGAFLGTLGYMSPEQVDPGVQDVDTRTDVYSLGIILSTLREHEVLRREIASIFAIKNGAGGGNRTHGLGIMRPSLFH